MRRLLSTAACALVMAAPVLASARPAPPEAPPGVSGEPSGKDKAERKDRGRDRAEQRAHGNERQRGAEAPPDRGARNKRSAEAAPAPPAAAVERPDRNRADTAPAQRDRGKAAAPAPSPSTVPPAATAERPGRDKNKAAAAPAPGTSATPPAAPAPGTPAKPPAATAAPVPGAMPPPAATAERPDRDRNRTTATPAPGAPAVPPATTVAPAPGAVPGTPPTATARPAAPPGAPAQPSAQAPGPMPPQRQAEHDRRGLSPGETLGVVGLAVAPWVAQALRGQPQDPGVVYVVPGRGPVPPPQYGGQTYTYYGPGAAPAQAGNPFVTRYEEVIIEERTTTSGQTARKSAGGGAAQPAAVPLAAPKDWRYDDVYRDGWSASRVIGSEVLGRDNRPIGTVNNILLGMEGDLAGLLVEVEAPQGGRTTLSIPWDKAELTRDGKVRVAVDPARFADYAMFGRDAALPLPVSGSLRMEASSTQPPNRLWQVTQLLDDYVMTSDAAGFGVVDDVILGPDKRIQAVVVHRDLAQGGGGAYAFPFFGEGYGFDPMLPFYALPYSAPQVANMPRFEEERMD